MSSSVSQVASALPQRPVARAPLGLLANRAFFVFLLIGFRAALDLAYVELISPYFAHAGYTLEFNQAHFAWTYVYLLIWGLVLPIHRRTVSSNLFCVLFLMIYVPASSLVGLRDDSWAFFELITLFFAMLLATITLIPAPAVEISVKYGMRIFVALAMGLFSIVGVVAIQRGLLGMTTLNMYEIYEVREGIQQQVFPGFMGYLASWLGKVLVPALLVVGVWARSITLVAMASVFAVMAYGGTTAKEMLFFPIFAVLGYLADRDRQFATIFLLAMIAGVFACLLWRGDDDASLLSALLVHRGLYIPSSIGFKYFYFFSENPHTYWSNAFLGKFIAYPYDEPIAVIIGRDSWGPGIHSFANTGVLGSAFMHFGTVGIAVFPIIMGLFFRLIDSLVNGRMPRSVGTAIALPAGLQFVNGDLTATLLSHGFGVVMIVLFLIGGVRGRDRSQSAH